MTIRKLLLVGVAILTSFATSAVAEDSYVHGYYRSNGAYVQGYHRTTPDGTVNNNYGTQGNVNPYSGQSGHVPRNEYQPQGAYNLGNGQGTLPTYPSGYGSGD